MNRNRVAATAAIALTVGGIIVASATVAQAAQTSTPLPDKGVTAITVAGDVWTATVASADLDEVKLIDPAQIVACSEHDGVSKNGYPICDATSFSFTSPAECVTIQFDWTNNLFDSSDPVACRPAVVPTATATSAPPAATAPPTTAPTDVPTIVPSAVPVATDTATLVPAIGTPPTLTPRHPQQTTPDVTFGRKATPIPDAVNPSRPTSGAEPVMLAATGIDDATPIALWIALIGISLGLAAIVTPLVWRRERRLTREHAQRQAIQSGDVTSSLFDDLR